MVFALADLADCAASSRTHPSPKVTLTQNDATFELRCSPSPGATYAATVAPIRPPTTRAQFGQCRPGAFARKTAICHG